jgi:hypothetical protein
VLLGQLEEAGQETAVPMDVVVRVEVSRRSVHEVEEALELAA